MTGLDPVIHAFRAALAWIAGSSPAMNISVDPAHTKLDTFTPLVPTQAELGEEPGARPAMGSARMRVAHIGGEQFHIALARVIATSEISALTTILACILTTASRPARR